MMQDCSMGVNQDCIAGYTSKGETWRCFFAQVHICKGKNSKRLLTCYFCSSSAPPPPTPPPPPALFPPPPPPPPPNTPTHPQYTYPYIKSPIFALNSQYDTWQLANILQLGCLPPKCSESQMKLFENFRNVRPVV